MPEPYPKVLEGNAPYGLAEADFPVTFYDRPSMMFGNLLRGDIDGATRAMLSPDTLTPSQMQDVTDRLTRGKKPSPVMKTILEISTNPLVIIGLVAGFMYPMASTKALLAIRKGMLPKAAAMGETISGLHGALMNLRTIPGAFDTLWDIVRKTKDFSVRHGEIARGIFTKAQAGRPLTKAEGYLVSARLDGLHKSSHQMVKILQKEPEYAAFFGGKDVPIAANLQKSMDTKLISLTDKMRNWLSGMWDDLYSNPTTASSARISAQKKGVKVGKKIPEDYWMHRGGYNKYKNAHLRGTTGVEYRKHLSDAYKTEIGPEMIERHGAMFAERKAILAMEQTGAIPQGFTTRVLDPILRRWSDDAANVAGGIWDDITKAGLGEAEQRIEFVNRMTEYYTKGPGKATNLVGRLGSKKTARDTLDAMAGALQDARGQGPDVIRRELSDIGKVLGSPAEYSMDLWEAPQKYLNSMASNYAYHSTGLGRKLHDIMETPGIFRDTPWVESYMKDGLIPHILGYNTFGQMQKTISNATRNMKMVDWIKRHPMVGQTLGANHTDALANWLSKPGALSNQTLGGQVANWFHISTLGLNLSATSANSMQTFITTINNVGPKGIWRGLMGYGGQQGVIQRGSNYMKMVAKGVSKKEAFRRAFPEFVEEVGDWSHTTERLLSGDVATMGLPKLFKAKGVWEKVKGAMMLPFSGTEAGNQLLAFYSGRHAHMFQNATKIGSKALSAEANKVGGSLALLTQFAGGPLGIPKQIMNMNPMWRQYMHFPMRYLAYLHGSLRMGVDPSKMDWGTIGRALAGSTAAYITARNMAGIDLSRGLMVGALPLPGYEKAPFYPFPFVPPAAGVLGEAGRALLTGKSKQLGSTASMLVPGGVALRRAYRSMSPKYADYENPTQDGRVPLYNNDGALIGSLTPMELTLRSLGVRPSSVTAEQGAAKWLLSQRDRVRQYRRDYTMALFQNETQKAEKINREFQKVYPELGALQIKKSDLRALENRREMSRLHRISRGMSRAYRPVFEQVIGTASLSRLAEDIEMGSAGALEQYFPLQ